MKDMTFFRLVRSIQLGQLVRYSLFAACGSLLSTASFGADTTWVAGNAGWDTPGSWDTVAVPGVGDRAIFNESATIAGYAVGLNVSNDFVSDVLFSATTKGVFWRGGATNTLTVGNSFVMDEPIGATAVGDIRDVTIAVTNASGTGIFKVGNNTDGGIGLLVMEQQSAGVSPTLIVDQFGMTTNSTFTFRSGTLTILHGSTIDRGTNTAFNIGSTAAQVPNWIMLGGTNTVTYTGATGGTSLGSATGAGANVTVSGPNTLWQVGGTQFNIGQNSVTTILVTNGAHVAATVGRLGNNTLAASNNVLTVTGAGSRVDFIGINPAAAVLTVGNVAPSNQLIIAGGAIVNATNGFVTIGSSTITGSANPANNLMKVDGAGSLFEANDLVQFGGGAPSNALVISNGGVVRSGSSTAASRLGRDATSTDNSALIDGIGSLWQITGPSGFSLGNNGPRNTLTIQNGGAMDISGSAAMLIGAGATSIGNQVTITGGSLTVTNATTSATMDVRNGTVTFNGGTITVDRLLVTNGASSVFTFNGGALNISTSVVANGSAFIVGNGTSAAKLNLLAFGQSFVDGLTIANNGTLTGVGTITANVTMSNGSTLAPGSAVVAGTQTVAGVMVLNSGTTLDYKLASPGGVGDLVNVAGDLTLDGTLNVFNLGGFAAGNYTIFSYTGILFNNTLNVGTLPGGFSGTISNDTVNKLVVLVAATSLPSDPFAAWEVQYFGSTNCAKCGATGDFDGDGMNNTNEFLVGFNPTNSAAYAHIISIIKTNNDIKVTYLGANGDSTRTPSIASRTNVLEFTTGAANGSYVTNSFVSTGVINILSGGNGTGLVTNMVDVGGATNKPSRFYRVRVIAP